MNLYSTQQLFWRSVRVDPAPPEVDEAFVDHGELTGRDRMAIYRNMYWVRQLAALRLTFEPLLALLGDQAFTELAGRYIRRHPSEHGALERLGRNMGVFLAEEGHPAWLVDVGRLEWQRLSALLAPDGPEPARPDAIDPAHFATQVPRFVGDLAVIRVHVEALRLRRLVSEDDVEGARAYLEALGEGEVDDRTVPVAVWRRHFSMRHASLSSEEAEALAMGRDGASLGEICTAFAHHDDPVSAAFAVLLPWFERQWITHLEAAP